MKIWVPRAVHENLCPKPVHESESGPLKQLSDKTFMYSIRTQTFMYSLDLNFHVQLGPKQIYVQIYGPNLFYVSGD